MDRNQSSASERSQKHLGESRKLLDCYFDDNLTASDVSQTIWNHSSVINQSPANLKQRLPAKLPENAVEWLLKVIHDSNKSVTKNTIADFDFSDDEFLLAKRSLFSSPLSATSFDGQENAIIIGQLMSSIISSCHLEGFNSEPKFFEMVKDLGITLTSGKSKKEVGMQPDFTRSIDEASVVSPIRHPLQMQIHYHRSLSDQIFDMSHLQKSATSLVDLDLKFINMEGAKLDLLLGVIGKLWLIGIFRSLNYNKLKRRASKFTSSKTTAYKSRFVEEFKKSVATDFNRFTFDLNIYASVSSLLLSLLVLYIKLLSFTSSRHEGAIKSYLVTERLSVEAYVANLKLSMTHEVSSNLLVSIQGRSAGRGIESHKCQTVYSV